MWDQFSSRYTDLHVFMAVIHRGSGAEFGSAMSHVFFSKDVMDDLSPLPVYRKVDDMAKEALRCE